jgi:hypothetical protein
MKNTLINEFFGTPIPEQVWHYTTVAGLEGILSSGTVWATEAHRTTDPSEFIHAREIASQFFDKFEPADKHSAYAKQAAIETVTHAFDKGALSPAQMEIFVASFSASSDLESQWDTYADSKRGVSIAFDLRKIRPPIDSGYAITFAPCIYEQKEKEVLIGAALNYWIATIAQLHHDTGSREWVFREFKNWADLNKLLGIESNVRNLSQRLRAV